MTTGGGLETMANDNQNDSAVTPRAPAPTRPARMDELAVLPVFFKLGGKRAVLAGGGEPAAWKAELLSACGAHVENICSRNLAGDAGSRGSAARWQHYAA